MLQNANLGKCDKIYAHVIKKIDLKERKLV